MTVSQDLRYALRTFRRSPGFAVVATLTLALGIGATTAMFSVVNGVLLEPLPYDAPGELVHLHSTWQGNRFPAVSYPDFVSIRDESESLTDLVAWQPWQVTLLGKDATPTREQGASVSSGFFDLFGATAAAGRFFAPEEGELGHAPVVVISYALWQSRFGGDDGILGGALELEGESYTVVGVASSDFVDPVTIDAPFDAPELWRARPPVFDENTARRTWRGFWAVGRLASSVGIDDARSELDLLGQRLVEQYPDSNSSIGFYLMGFDERLLGPVRPAALLLMAAVVLVLLVACANVANLLLSRASVRRREIAIRRAVGASRSRVVRQLVTESLVLAGVATLAAIPLAVYGSRTLVALAGEGIPRAGNISMDGSVFLFTMGVAIVTGVLFGVAPAFQATRMSFVATTRTDRSSSRRLRDGLAVAEIALAMLLLVGAGLLLKSFSKLSDVDPGIETESVLTFRVTPSVTAYPDPHDVTLVMERLIARLASLPGVETVGAVHALPMSNRVDNLWVRRADRPEPAPGERSLGLVRAVTDDYFEAMGMTLVRGRRFDDSDDAESPSVTIINETLAREHFGSDDPVGHFLIAMDVSREIVGVVSDVRQFGLAQDVHAAFFSPFEQESEEWARRTMTLVLRTEGHPELAAGPAREAVRAIDSTIPVHELRTMESFVFEDMARPRFRTVLLTLFASVAVILAAIGVAGVMSYTVSQRQREIAVRMAVGADRGGILRLVASDGLKMSALGVGIGAVGALLVSRVLSGLLFGVTPQDPVIFVSVALGIFALGLLSTCLPAWRATRVDPASTLRSE